MMVCKEIFFSATTGVERRFGKGLLVIKGLRVLKSL